MTFNDLPTVHAWLAIVGLDKETVKQLKDRERELLRGVKV